MDKRIWAIAMAALFTTGAMAAGDTTDAASEAGTPGQEGAAMGGAATGGEMSFSELDQDGDGQISREEAEAHPDLAENFDQYDESGTGALDESEFAAFQESQTGTGSEPGAMPPSDPGAAGDTSPGGTMGTEPGAAGSEEPAGGGSEMPQ